jgi:hypothetical protein
MIGWQGLWDQGLGILCTLFEDKWVERTTGIYLLICLYSIIGFVVAWWHIV